MAVEPHPKPTASVGAASAGNMGAMPGPAAPIDAVGCGPGLGSIAKYVNAQWEVAYEGIAKKVPRAESTKAHKKITT